MYRYLFFCRECIEKSVLFIDNEISEKNAEKIIIFTSITRKEIKMIKRNFFAFVITALMIGMIPFYSATATSTRAVLHTDEKTAKTGYLGNTTGKYRLVGAVATTSEYPVEYYLYKAATSEDKKIQESKFAYSSSAAFKYSYTIDKKKFTVARCKLYGNKKSNPKTECYANVILSDQ